jgi:hypothetical protein
MSATIACRGMTTIAGVLVLVTSSFAADPPAPARVAFERDDARGQMAVRIDGKEALVYQYAPDLDLVHYLLDLSFTVTASYGDVTFTSDWSHYAWPYVRMRKEFSEENGGMITNSEGGQHQQDTLARPAHWADYSNTVEGTTEGLAIFSHADNPYPHKWFNRFYGCFGPRRADERSGKPFTLKKGESLQQRVGILVHRGDVREGRVAERYQQYIGGKL